MVRVLAVILGLGIAGASCAQSLPALVPLARIGPWQGVSALIGFRGRLWFANSEKFVNHNSADLYSYAPGEAGPRYERHLFSQDAGQPLVTGGLLFWPFEDSRFSTGHGEFMVTNGRDWRWQPLPEGEVFHIHAMIANGGALYAATSAWRAGLQRSDDRGRSWRVIQDYPTPPGRVSRFTSLAVLAGVVYAGLTRYSQPGPRLYRFPGDQAQPVPGWPAGVRTEALVSFGGWLYALNRNSETTAVWRTNGQRSEPVQALEGVPVQAFAVGPRALWAVSGDQNGGSLWRSTTGVGWRRLQHFAGAFPLSIAIFAEQPYVGTLGPGNQGTLWGPAQAESAGPPASFAEWPDIAKPLMTRQRLSAQLQILDRVLAGSPVSFNALRRNLAAALDPLIKATAPGLGQALAARLDGVPSGAVLKGFGGKLRIHPRQLKQWYLLRAIALSGGARVPPAMLEAAWHSAPNGPEKYFQPLPAALWAAGVLGQGDAATLKALVSHLGTAGEPAWLDGDRIGALTAISGRRFGYDRAAWRRWWAARPGNAANQ